MDRLRVVSGLTVGAVLLGVLAVAAPVRATIRSAVEVGDVAGQHYYRLRADAGDAKYLVYSKRQVNSDDLDPADTSALYFRTLHGKPHRIGTITDLAGDFSLGGSILVYEDSSLTDPNQESQYRWRNLATGAHGLTHGGFTATPTGWIDTTNTHSFVLEQVTVKGRVTVLGAPFPGRSEYLTTYAHGEVIAYNLVDGSGHGVARWVSFAHPGVFHTFISSGPADSTASCPVATSSGIACQVSRGLTPTMRLYTLHGKLLAKVTTCAEGQPAVLHHSLAWVPQAGHCSHRLRVASKGGTVKVSTTKFVVGDTVSAFGGVVVPTKTQKRLVFFTSATNSRTLVRTQ